MNIGRLCQINLKSDKEISGYRQLAQHVIFAYHMVRPFPLIALPSLRFPDLNGNFPIDRRVFLIASSCLKSLFEPLRRAEFRSKYNGRFR